MTEETASSRQRRARGFTKFIQPPAATLVDYDVNDGPFWYVSGLPPSSPTVHSHFFLFPSVGVLIRKRVDQYD